MRLLNNEMRFTKLKYFNEYLTILKNYLNQHCVYDEKLTIFENKYANYDS